MKVVPFDRERVSHGPPAGTVSFNYLLMVVSRSLWRIPLHPGAAGRRFLDAAAQAFVRADSPAADRDMNLGEQGILTER